MHKRVSKGELHLSMRLAVWPLIFGLTASAQFQNLATTDDGQQLYFSTPFRLRNTDQFSSPKIFTYLQNTSSFKLVAEVQEQSASRGTNLFQLTQPDISSDGSILVYTANGICTGGTACLGYVGSAGQITGATVSTDLLQGETVRISRDGQYLLAFGAKTQVVQLATGQSVTLHAKPIGDAYEALADGGTVLLSDDQGPVLIQGGTITRLHLSKTPRVARISRDARRMIYEAFDVGQPNQLIAYDVGSASETLLAQATAVTTPDSPYFLPWLTDDGLQAIYQAAPSSGMPKQVFLISTATGATQKLTDIPEGISAAVISGLGNIIYTATPSNRLFEGDIATGNLNQLTNRTPQIGSRVGGSAPGSLIGLTGVALSRTDGTASVQIGGLDAPTVDFGPESGSFQIPWELSLGNPNGSLMTVSVGAEPDSLFEQVFSINVLEVDPTFLTIPAASGSRQQAIIAHQDFHGLVTVTDPAVPGEILHFYMTGLGPVSPTIGTGRVTPAGSVFVVSTPPSCLFVERIATPVTLLFAGLAPGLLGIDQLDVQVPQGLTTRTPTFQCIGYLPVGQINAYASVPLRACLTARTQVESRGKPCEASGVIAMGKSSGLPSFHASQR